MKFVSTLGLLVILSACSKDSDIKEAVRVALKDPESARFGMIDYSKDGTSACASVNAKNGMGGYTGFSEVELVKDNGKWTYKTDYGQSTTHEECVRMLEVDTSKILECNDMGGC